MKDKKIAEMPYNKQIMYDKIYYAYNKIKASLSTAKSPEVQDDFDLDITFEEWMTHAYYSQCLLKH